MKVLITGDEVHDGLGNVFKKGDTPDIRGDIAEVLIKIGKAEPVGAAPPQEPE